MKKNSLHIIKNFDELATTPARTSLLTIAEAGYTAIETAKVIQSAVVVQGDTLVIQGKTYNLSEYKNIYVLGVGKCALDSAVELEAILGNRITDGVVVDVRSDAVLTKIKSYKGTHPFPSAENVTYTGKLLALAQKATEHDLVLIIVSGGGSTLLCQPKTHTVADEAGLVQFLFRAGATIEELNTIRKHLSLARGGFLATTASPATVVALLFSDVPGNDIRTIASSPTVFDETTREDALKVFAKYQAESSGFSTEHFIETPKEKDFFSRVQNALVLKNTTALEAMKKCAEGLGYTTEIKETKLQGEARVVGVELVHAIRMAKPRTVHLYGGETTVTITGPGKGGRNEELSLATVPIIEDDELIVSLASDGHDNTDFAGGIADKYTKGKAEDAKLKPENFLYTNDSYSFFHSLQQGIITGYTGANIADLVIVIKHER
jgi:glycerate 2-kinase